MDIRGPGFDSPRHNQVHQADHGGFRGQILEVLDILQVFTPDVATLEILHNPVQSGSLGSVELLDQVEDGILRGQEHLKLLETSVNANGVQSGIILGIGHGKDQSFILLQAHGNELAFAHELHREGVFQHRNLRKLLGRQKGNSQIVTQVGRQIRLGNRSNVDKEFSDSVSGLVLQTERSRQLFR